MAGEIEVSLLKPDGKEADYPGYERVIIGPDQYREQDGMIVFDGKIRFPMATGGFCKISGFAVQKVGRYISGPLVPEILVGKDTTPQIVFAQVKEEIT